MARAPGYSRLVVAFRSLGPLAWMLAGAMPFAVSAARAAGSVPVPVAAESAPAPRAVKGIPNAGSPQPPELSLRGMLAWKNDQFFPKNGDDQGFTGDLAGGLFLLHGRDEWGVLAVHRQLTERDGWRRSDELTGIARWLKEFETPGVVWTAGPHAGIAGSGNFGGRWLQDWFHRTIGMGRTIEPSKQDPWGTLQYQYPTRRRFAGLVGVRGGPSIDLFRGFSLVTGVLAQGAIGRTGLSQLALYSSLEWQMPSRGLRLFVGLGLDAAIFHTRDPSLMLDGGYRGDMWQLLPHFRVSIRDDFFEAGYDARMNVDGAGTHMGSFYGLVGGGSSHRREHNFR